MTRILYVEPVGHDLFTSHFATFLEQHAGPTTDVTVTHLGLDTPATSPFLPSSPVYQGDLFRCIVQAEVDGYDGVVIGCASDPGLRQARRSVGIPVVGPFSASLHLAAMRAERIGVVTPGPRREVTWLWDCAREYGLEHAIADVVIAEVAHPPEDEALARRMRNDPAGVREQVLDAHRQSVTPEGGAFRAAAQLVDQHQAGALVFACTFWAGMLSDVEGRLGVPAIDPVLASLRVAEVLA